MDKEALLSLAADIREFNEFMNDESRDDWFDGNNIACRIVRRLEDAISAQSLDEGWFPEYMDMLTGDRQEINADTFIKEWYTAKFPTDTVGEDIADGLTFKGFYTAMQDGRDVYCVLGGVPDGELSGMDSVVRERVFPELSKAMGVDYDVIYDLWIHGPETPAVGIAALQDYATQGIVLDNNIETSNIEQDIEK